MERGFFCLRELEADVPLEGLELPHRGEILHRILSLDDVVQQEVVRHHELVQATLQTGDRERGSKEG